MTDGLLPERAAVRVLVLDEQGRTLLCQFGDDATGRTWWVPPGGGKEPGESDLEAAARELSEELDRTDLEIGPCIGTRDGGTVVVQGRRLAQQERFYLCRCRHFEVTPEVVRRSRPEGIRDIRWWTADDIRSRGIDTGPQRLADLIELIADGTLPASDEDLGW